MSTKLFKSGLDIWLERTRQVDRCMRLRLLHGACSLIFSQRRTARRLRHGLLILAGLPLIYFAACHMGAWVEKLCALMGGIDPRVS